MHKSGFIWQEFCGWRDDYVRALQLVRDDVAKCDDDDLAWLPHFALDYVTDLEDIRMVESVMASKAKLKSDYLHVRPVFRIWMHTADFLFTA